MLNFKRVGDYPLYEILRQKYNNNNQIILLIFQSAKTMIQNAGCGQFSGYVKRRRRQG